SKEMNVNETIRAREVRLIDANGDQLGVKSRNEALQIAQTRNLDLVLVAPGAKPPVCRIMDYGKYRFEQQKKEKEARKKQRDRKSTRLNSSHVSISYAVFCLKKKKKKKKKKDKKQKQKKKKKT